VDEGNAPGYPLGCGRYGSSIEPVQAVGNADEGGGDDGGGDSGSDVGPSGTADEGGKGVPLYGRGSKIVMGTK
jgi:hypothetical protein